MIARAKWVFRLTAPQRQNSSKVSQHIPRIDLRAFTGSEKFRRTGTKSVGKYFFREVDELSVTGEEELLSVSHTTGVTPRSQKNVTMFKAESYVGHKVARPNDVVINTMWAWMSALGVSKNVGIISPAYGVYRPHNEQDFLPEYVNYLLRTSMLKWEYICRSTGIRASRLRLYPDKFLDIPLPCPPIAEQEKMLRFCA